MQMTKLPEQRLEDRLRREAKKLGLKVVKSRARDPEAGDLRLLLGRGC
jgi:hypothetical protein